MVYKSCKIYDFQAKIVMKGLCIADIMNLYDTDTQLAKSEENLDLYNLKELAISDVLTCSYCSTSFENTVDQRNHYKLDWHRCNVKRALNESEPISQDQFNLLAGDTNSASDSENDIFSIRQEFVGGIRSDGKCVETSTTISSPKTNRHTKVFFENSDNEILSVYRCLLQSRKECLLYNDFVLKACELIKQPIKWMVVMLGGGHFAGAVFENENIVLHKTFHSYTVRAKQGGTQSTKDNKGSGHSKSAGASLRRYNEQSLVQHVQEIITDWSDTIKHCSLIFYRATGPCNRSVLFGGKNPPLNKTDKRLRSIPFPTKKATFKEVKRVYDILSNIEIYGSASDFKNKFPKSPDKRFESDVSENQNEVQIAKEKISKNININEKCLEKENPVFTKSEDSSEEGNEIMLTWNDHTIDFNHLQEFEDTVKQDKMKIKRRQSKYNKKKKKIDFEKSIEMKNQTWQNELYSLQEKLLKCCKSRDKKSFAELLGQNFNNQLTNEQIMNILNMSVDEESGNTLLHLAAIDGISDFVELLLKSGADPQIKNKKKLTPYDLADDKQTKTTFEEFKTFRFQDKLEKVHLTKEMKSEKAHLKRIKEKTKKEKKKSEMKENEEKKIFLALSDSEKCAVQKGCSDRVNGPNIKSTLPRCFQCGVDISKIVPFEYSLYKFCSISCLKSHRTKTNSYGIEI